MIIKIYFAVLTFVTSIFYLNLFVAISVLKRRITKDFLSNIYMYPLVGAIVAIFLWLRIAGIIEDKSLQFVNRLSLFFHYCYLSYLIYNFTGKKYAFRVVIFSVFIFISVAIFSDLFGSSIISFGVTNTALLIYSLYYFKIILDGPPSFDLFKAPGFFICSGLLLGCGLIIPFSLSNKYLVLMHIPKNSLYLLGFMSPIGYLVINLFFLKAILCLRNPQK